MQASANSARAAQQAGLYHGHHGHDDRRSSQPLVHSGRLVYARPQDLPSFPSIGLDAKGSAASAAATLGWANKKSPEPWRPSASTSASTAAIMAEDSKAVPVREPAASSHGANTALLAAQSATGHSASKPALSDSGVSAATAAFKSSRSDVRNTKSGALERHGSLLAAQGAVARRQRAGSAPVPRESYPDEANAAANALNAATRAHRPASYGIPLEEAGAVPYTTMNRLMFTSRPPVKSEVDEQKRADVLHASAIAMAKKMYSQQQKMIDAKKVYADRTLVRGNLEVSSSISDDPQPAQLTTLQDAAYKQAQARLAKMQEKNAQNSNLQDYYGTAPSSQRRSIKGKLRKRSLSDGVVIEDQRRSQQIKKQMSLFSNRLSEIDEHKQQHDQDLLLAAAQRNVHERLKSMDAKIATETGMVPPSTLTQWELNARAIAQSRALQQNNRQQGQVDLGAGILMDREDINAIAARRIQPILDEINAKAELEHARQLELRLETERKREEQEVEKARQREAHDIQKKLKQQERLEQKGKRAEEKQEAKARKGEGKAAKAEQQKLARAEKTRSVEQDQKAAEIESQEEMNNNNNNSIQPVEVLRLTDQETRPQTSPEMLEESPKSPSGKIKNWLKSRFSRGPRSPTEEQNKGKETEKGFIGGVTLTGNRSNKSATSLGVDPAIISSTNTESEDDLSGNEVGNQRKVMLTPPRPVTGSSSARVQSPARDSRFHEIIE
ncbi:hypothetical protein F4801DRAFT_297154 [Xylaria longipes]|nr:hypothetical protein F4801DRAFT_297154 [Xylaria longipes]RYC54238.1 hypothetical protein CHU98_g11972 [Xylaria longipes]